MIYVDEAAQAVPADGQAPFRRRALRPARGPCRSVRRHACLCQGGAHRSAPRSYRFNRVDDLHAARRTAPGTSITDKGTVHAEHVVNAGGLWAREVGRMVGLELPVLAMEHQYLITEDMPEVARSRSTEMLHAIDFEGEIYMRQERKRHAARHLRASRRAVVGARDAVGLRPRAAAARPRPHRAVARGRLPAFPGARAAPASSRSSTARSPSRPTAIRWSARCAA